MSADHCHVKRVLIQDHGPADRRRTRLALTCAVGLLIAFVGLGAVAHVAADGTAVDHAVLDWMIGHRSAWLTTAAIAVTTAGSPVVMGLSGVCAAAVLWWRRRSPMSGLVVVSVLAAASLTSTLVKVVVGARRPPRSVQLVLEVDHSFPSGHVTGTLALVGIIAVLSGGGRRLSIRIALVCGVFVVTSAVALTRLYLGVHWLTDIGGGLMLGGLALLVCWVTLSTVTAPPMSEDGPPLESPASGAARVA